jgi:hypothetical protein
MGPALNQCIRNSARGMREIGMFFCLWSLVSIATPARGSDASEHQDYMNGGYYLLHQICSDEASLPMIFIVKDAPPEIEDYAKHVSQTAKETLTELERMQKANPRINFDKNPLPPFERDVRDSIKDGKQNQLLFGTSGPQFVQALLIAQIEASNYALNLAKVLSEGEKDPDRAKVLKRISAKWQTIREESSRLMQKPTH